MSTRGIVRFAIGTSAWASWQDSKTEPLEGSYIVHGGNMGDWYAPKPGDAKVNLEITGALAKQMFALMGARAEKKDSCGEDGESARVTGDILPPPN